VNDKHAGPDPDTRTAIGPDAGPFNALIDRLTA
jgi:hypothetical protein